MRAIFEQILVLILSIGILIFVSIIVVPREIVFFLENQGSAKICVAEKSIAVFQQMELDFSSQPEIMMQNILVAGATGGVGVQLVKKLLTRNVPVRALVRDEVRARNTLGPKVQLVVGDTGNPNTLRAAVENTQGIICTIGAKGSWFGENSAQSVDYQGVKNLVDATLAYNKNAPFVLVSSTSVTKTFSFLQLLGRLGHWKLEGENYLRASGLNYVVVRPAALNDEDGGKMPLEFGQRDKMGWRKISRADVATVCIKALDFLQHNIVKNITFEVAETNIGEVPSAEMLQDMFGKLEMDK